MPILGLAPKPTYEVAVFASTGTCWYHRKELPADEVIPVLTRWIHERSDVTVRIDGEDVTAAARATPAIIRGSALRRGQPAPDEPDDSRGPGHLDVASAWRFLLTDDNVLHRIPLAAEPAGEAALRAGAGPGDLSWQPTEDHGIPGLRAVHRGGTFMILRVGSDQCALVYERTAGDWEAIATGPPEVLKKRAAARSEPPKYDFATLIIQNSWKRIGTKR
jgi:hypothetical protein